ncbi:MAG: hypothetical protein WCK21_08480 [Actinomycetota bacterium]
MNPVTASPATLTANATIDELVRAYATGSRHPFALVSDDGALRFICPKCGRVTHNGGTAVVVDAWRWSCHACRHIGMRDHLARLVLEDATMLEALYEEVST